MLEVHSCGNSALCNSSCLSHQQKKKNEMTESAMPSRGIALSLILTSSAGNLCLELTADEMNGSSSGQKISVGLKTF